MKNYKVWIVIVNLVLLLAFFNYSVIKKEQVLDEGQLILLELAPVDPRSLMQGDYMILNYAIARNIPQQLDYKLPKRGYVVVKLDQHHVAHYIRLQDDVFPLNTSEYLIKYTSPNQHQMNLGAESFFFQEGHAQRYEEAQYGALKVDTKGNSILVGLYNQNLKKID